MFDTEKLKALVNKLRKELKDDPEEFEVDEHILLMASEMENMKEAISIIVEHAEGLKEEIKSLQRQVDYLSGDKK